MISKLGAAWAAVWRACGRRALVLFDLSVQGALAAALLLDVYTHLLLRRAATAPAAPAFLDEYAAAACGVAEGSAAAAAAWGGRGARPRAIALSLAFCSLCALLLFAVPFNDDQRHSHVELCSGKPILFSQYTTVRVENNDEIDQHFVTRTIILLVTAMSCAIAKLSLWVHGLTYLDDHQPQNGPFYYGILISIRLSLGVGAVGWLRDAAHGAHWARAQLPLALLPLPCAAALAAFPRALPGSPPDLAAPLKFMESLGRIIKNKFAMVMTVAVGFLQLAVLSITQNDAAYVQGTFLMEAVRQNVSSDIFRTLVILFFIMIFRVRFSGRRAQGVAAGVAARVGAGAAAAAAALCGALLAARCPRAAPRAAPACSRHCACAARLPDFAPVCALDTLDTYFSPCDAGCEHYENLNGFIVFQNCTCGLQRAVRGSCSLGECSAAYSVYQVLYTLLIAVAGAGLLMQGMAVLRSLEQRDKTLGLGVSFAIVALISNVLGRLMFLLISSRSCAVRRGAGRCALQGAGAWGPGAATATAAASAAATAVAAALLHPP